MTESHETAYFKVANNWFNRSATKEHLRNNNYYLVNTLQIMLRDQDGCSSDRINTGL